MSIVVAVKKAGKIVIAADTLYSFGSTKVSPTYLSKRSKIHQIGDSYFGITGASAHDNVLPHLIEKHKEIISFDNQKDIFATFLKIHSLLKDEYFLNTYDDDNATYEPSKVEGLIVNSNGYSVFMTDVRFMNLTSFGQSFPARNMLWVLCFQLMIYLIRQKKLQKWQLKQVANLMMDAVCLWKATQLN